MSSTPEHTSEPKPPREWSVVDSAIGKISGDMPCGIVRTKGNGGKGTRVGPDKPSNNK